MSSQSTYASVRFSETTSYLLYHYSYSWFEDKPVESGYVVMVSIEDPGEVIKLPVAHTTGMFAIPTIDKARYDEMIDCTLQAGAVAEVYRIRMTDASEHRR